MRRLLLSALVLLLASAAARAGEVKRYLYVAAPGIRDYLEFGGAGVLVFDVDDRHRFVKRIATAASKADRPANIKGVCACAETKRLYFTTPKALFCVDLLSDHASAP